MRVLLTQHFPIDGDAGRATRDLATALVAAGHEVHCLAIDRQRHAQKNQETFPVRRIICRAGDPAADLPFDVPGFTSQPPSGPTFSALSDEQLAAYREALRRHLDAEVKEFDPHIIHAQHIWVLAQLALESGVPYVVTACGPELEGAIDDSRYRRLADQAAENAGAILASSELVRDRVCRTFETVADRTFVVPPASDVLAAERCAQIYQRVLRERFGAARS